MKRRAVFQLRLSEDEARRLDEQAAEAHLSKADLIRRALGWETTNLPTRDAPPRDPASPPSKAVDGDRQPGLAALQQIAARLQRKS